MVFEGKHWVRRDRIAEFDITMGATDSAQVTDLVGLYLIHELALEFPELEGGAYRDDALFIVKLLFTENALPQISQRYGFSPV